MQDEQKMGRRTLLAWWGCFPGSATFGDLLAVHAVSTRLAEQGIPFDFAATRLYSEIEYAVVDWRTVDPDQYETLIFVCGPISGKVPAFRALLKRFDQCFKLAAGVSVLPEASPSFWMPFDKVVARDGAPKSHFDLALASSLLSGPERQSDRRKGRKLRIGTCLRGRQKEYGEENCLDDKAAEMASEVVNRLGAEAIDFDTVLENADVSLEEFLARIATLDLMITTRLHGSLLSLHALTPFIALDQIKGGAKVERVLQQIGYPWVHRLDGARFDEVMDFAQQAIEGEFEPELLVCRSRAWRRSRLAAASVMGALQRHRSIAIQ